MLTAAAAVLLSATALLPRVALAQPPTKFVCDQLGSTALNDEATSAVALNDGGVYVVGAFTTAGGNAANKVARWDTTASSTSNGWSAVGTGVGPTGGTARFNVITARETTKYSTIMGGIAFVGGSFSAVDGVSAANVAKYTPAVAPAVGTWAALGTGCDGEVLAAAAKNDTTAYFGGGERQQQRRSITFA